MRGEVVANLVEVAVALDQIGVLHGAFTLELVERQLDHFQTGLNALTKTVIIVVGDAEVG